MRWLSGRAMRALVVCACVVTLGTACSQAQNEETASISPRETAETAWGEGNRAVAQGNFSQALAHFDQAIAADPSLAPLYVARGGAYLAQQDFARAQQDFDAAIARDANLAQAYYARGTLMWLLGRMSEAERDYGQLVRFRPDDGFYAQRYAIILFDQGKPGEMEAFYRAAVQADSTRDWAIAGLLDAVQTNSGVDAALAESRRLFDAGVSEVTTRMFLGDGYFKQGNYYEAASWLQPLLEKDPNEVALDAVFQYAEASARSYQLGNCVIGMRSWFERQGRPNAFIEQNEIARCQTWSSS